MTSIRPHKPFGDGELIDPVFGRVWQKDISGIAPGAQKDLSASFCRKPFEWLEIDMSGRAWMCCPSWLPFSIGNVFDSTILELWHNEKAKRLRESMLDGSFRYCNHVLCPEIASNTLPKMPDELRTPAYPRRVNFSFDESCNLECPSCRVGRILYASGPDYERRKAILDKVVSELLAEPHDRPLSLFITGSGDPFGSKIFREFLTGFDPTSWPNLRLNFQTNGVMMTPKMWNKIAPWHDRFDDIRVSFDAACASTYAVTRKGGDWDLLLENMDYLNLEARKHKIKVFADFVVQDLNVGEMGDYARLVTERYPNFRAIHFSLVTDWGTWDAETYRQRAIWKTDHPDHHRLLEALQDPIMEHRKVHLGNVRSAISGGG